MFEIILPYTPAKLNPNRSKTLTSFEYAREFKKYKQQAFFLTKEALGGKPAPDCSQLESLPLYLTFYPPDRRKRDDDNMIASFKAGRDGIAQALGIDDNLFHIQKPQLGEPVRPNGQIRVQIDFSGETVKKEVAPENNAEIQKKSQKGKTNNPAGRPKGVPNKITTAVKTMVLQALDEMGGVEYLKMIAQIEPKAFCSLLSKCMPQEVTGKDGKDLIPSHAGVLVIPEALTADDWGLTAERVIAEQEANKKKYMGADDEQ